MPAKNADTTSAIFTEEFNKKLPILLVTVVFFVLTLYTFLNTKIGLSTFFDFGRIAAEPTGLINAPVILFAVAFAITLSTSAFFGIGLDKKQAAIPGIIFIVLSLLTLAIKPSHTPLFFAFALSLGSAPLFAALKEQVDFEAFNTATRRALLVLTILVVLFSIGLIELNKDAYLDRFLTGAASLSPQLAQQVLPLCAQPFSRVDPEQVVPRSATAVQAATTYDNYRTSIIQNSQSQCDLQSDVPAFNSLSPEQQEEFREQAHSTTVLTIRQILRGLTEQLQSEELEQQLAEFQPTRSNLDELRSQLQSVPYYRLVQDYFSLFMALILFSILSIFTFVIKALNYPLNYAMLKLRKVNIEAKE